MTTWIGIERYGDFQVLGPWTTIALCLTLLATPCSGEEYQVDRRPDAPFSFKIMSIVVNEGSTLQRESVVLNVPSCPIAITSNTLKIDFKDRRFRYNMTTELTASMSVAAVEVRYLLFDVFGRHMKNLQNLEPKDLAAGEHKVSGTWNMLRENDLSRHLTTVTYIANVRLTDGRIWRADFDQVSSVLSTLKLERTVEEDDDDQ